MKTNSPYHCWADCVQKCCNFPGDVIRVMWLDNQASSFCREKCKIIVPHEVYLNMMINKCKMESTDHAIFEAVCVSGWFQFSIKVKCIGREFRVPANYPETRLCCWKSSSVQEFLRCPEHCCCSIVFSRHKSSQNCWLLLFELMPH